jgi:hypothetical protein
MLSTMASRSHDENYRSFPPLKLFIQSCFTGSVLLKEHMQHSEVMPHLIIIIISSSSSIFWVTKFLQLKENCGCWLA